MNRLLAAATVSLLVGPSAAIAQGLFEEAVAGEVEETADESESESPVTSSGSSSTSGSRSPVQGGGLAAPSLDLGGWVRADVWAGEDPDVRGAELKSGYGELALTARTRAGGWGAAFGELRLRAGSDFGVTTEAVRLREAYVDLFLGPVDLRIGHQVIAWGRADGINPTDELTPRDMGIRSPNPDDRRGANLGLRMNVYLQPARFEVVWLPAFAPSRFPPFDLPGALTLGEPTYPNANLENGTAAARVHLETSLVEGSVSYVYGHAPFPGLRLNEFLLDPTATPPVTIEAGFAAWRRHLVGLDFAAPVGTLFGLRGEAAARFPIDDAAHEWVPLPDVQYVVGVDREVATNVMVVLQYVGRTVLEWDGLESRLSGVFEPGGTPPELDDILDTLNPEERDQFLSEVLAGEPPTLMRNELRLRTRMLQGQTHEVTHSVALAVRWLTLHETLQLEVGGNVNLTTEEWLLRPMATWKVTDRLEGSIGAEVYRGPDDTLFGLVEDVLTAGFLEVKAYF